MNPGLLPLCAAFLTLEAQKKPVDPQRAAFEAWADTLDMDTDTIETPEHEHLYSDCNTDYAWQAWQASRKQMAEEAMKICRRQAERYPRIGDQHTFQAVKGCEDAIRRLSSPEGGL